MLVQRIKRDVYKRQVSAWSAANGISLGQVKVDDKSNEITAVPLLIHALDLDDCIVTIDAMGCQLEITKAIIERNSNYIIAVSYTHLFFQGFCSQEDNRNVGIGSTHILCQSKSVFFRHHYVKHTQVIFILQESLITSFPIGIQPVSYTHLIR